MSFSKVIVLAALVFASLAPSGCLRPRQGQEPPRSYVLSPTPATSAATNSPSAGQDLGVGLGPVQIPSYLWDSRLALRRGQSEILYLENHRWAERLDRGIQRVLAENLARSLNSGRVVLSAWARDAIQAELHVSIQRFEPDDAGRVHLEARWQIVAPGGEPTLLTRRSHIVRPMPSGAPDAQSIVAELSEAIAELSRQIAAVLPVALKE